MNRLLQSGLLPSPILTRLAREAQERGTDIDASYALGNFDIAALLSCNESLFGIASMESPVISVSKLDAAKSQLDTAIRLWFEDADPISAHALASSAYQLIHDLNVHANGADLLLDAALVREEHRKEWVNTIKAPSNFFKHADKDPAGKLEFKPALTIAFIMFSSIGLKQLGEEKSELLGAFSSWISFHLPQFFDKKVTKELNAAISEEAREMIKATSKQEFFAITQQAFKIIKAKSDQ